jgi:hypothetical protein
MVCAVKAFHNDGSLEDFPQDALLAPGVLAA